MSLNRKLNELTVVDGICFYRVPSDNRFAVSECGKVLGRFGKVLKPRSNGRYPIISYRDKTAPGGYRNYYVHHLVAEVFHGESVLEVNHKDGNKLNNHWTNLEYVTRRENHLHGVELGLIWNIPAPGQRGFQCSA